MSTNPTPAFTVYNRRPIPSATGQDGAAVLSAWLRTEFQLNDAQYASIGKLHDDYGLVCGEHCTAIMAAKKRNAPAAEIGALEKICVNAMMEHFQRVAALM